MTRRGIAALPLVLILAAVGGILCGCAFAKKSGSIRVEPTGEVVAKNADNATQPAKVETAKSETTATIEPGTKAEVPAEVAGKPVVISVEFPRINFVSTQAKTEASAANERAPDRTVELHKLAAEERRWLLWAAICCGIVGVVIRQLMPAWPSLSHGLLVGAALAFGAWKFDQIPQWIFAVVIGAVALIALGYKRSEWDANHNGIPDVLEKK